MKIRMHNSDGEYVGGLFKTDSRNAMNCRVWHAPPHPDYQESLIDIAGKGNPCYDSSWVRLQIAKVPDLSGPPDHSDDFDENSRAYQISLLEASAWFVRHGFSLPKDLIDLLGEKPSGDTVNPVALGDAPIPDGAREVWDLLMNKALTAKELAGIIGSSEDAVRKRIESLNAMGRIVSNRRGSGYYRPDAMPQE